MHDAIQAYGTEGLHIFHGALNNYMSKKQAIIN